MHIILSCNLIPHANKSTNLTNICPSPTSSVLLPQNSFIVPKVIFENLRKLKGGGAGGGLGALLDAAASNNEHEWWCPYGIQIEIFKLPQKDSNTEGSTAANSRPHSRKSSKSSTNNGSKTL